MTSLVWSRVPRQSLFCAVQYRHSYVLPSACHHRLHSCSSHFLIKHTPHDSPIPALMFCLFSFYHHLHSRHSYFSLSPLPTLHITFQCLRHAPFPSSLAAAFFQQATTLHASQFSCQAAPHPPRHTNTGTHVFFVVCCCCCPALVVITAVGITDVRTPEAQTHR